MEGRRAMAECVRRARRRGYVILGYRHRGGYCYLRTVLRKKTGSGGRTRTCDTRIMIPLL